MKIYVVGGDNNYASWMGGEIVRELDPADLVVFSGGEDVTPSYYNEPAHPRTSCNPRRDASEQFMFQRALAKGKKMVGICRGAQFLCVMAGGKLVQDQEIQHMYHMMRTTNDNGDILVSSTHHQAQWPWNLQADERTLLGYTQNLSSWHEDGRQVEIVNNKLIGGIEVEVCYYPKIQALAIQPHPEYYYGSARDEHVKSIDYFQKLLKQLMEGKL
jgi:GMP synthase-like glutamine amidotransferase